MKQTSKDLNTLEDFENSNKNQIITDNNKSKAETLSFDELKN